MNKFDLFRMSRQNLMRRKTRSVLTIIGVMIGTASIVIMLSLGIAMDRQFKEQISQMGSLNIIDVYPGYYGGYDRPGGEGQNTALDDHAVSQFEQIKGVKAVMPQKTSYYKIAAGKMVGHVGVIGVKPENLAAFDFEIEEGRLLIDGDKEAIIFGSQIAYNFYNPRLSNHYYGPMGSNPPEVNLISDKLILTANMAYGERQQGGTDPDYRPPKLHEIKGVGILKQSNNEKDYNAYMNMAYLEKILAEDRKNEQSNSGQRPVNDNNQNQYDNIKVKCENIEVVAAVQEKIKALGYMSHSLTDILESMKKTSRTMQAILGGIGAVSLLVAAIGITNTMIMSIYERTKEIGIIKVLGADIADIKRLFLLEAALIGLVGGVIGLLLSYTVSWVLNSFVPNMIGGMGVGGISYIPPLLAIGALIFSTMVGIIAGYSPAHRAMNLSALEAIRTE
ncbi:MAG: ABC transporter permease [Syntrophomonadaceae bacterium]|jgi:ABC-type antimicrobial peptide transport system permease subunit|nr:ABC transporter permease [Syntrophomonadaceae bacterium]